MIRQHRRKLFVRVGKIVLSLLSRIVGVLGAETRLKVYLSEIRKTVPNGDERVQVYLREIEPLIESEERCLIPRFEPGRGPARDRYLTYQKDYVRFDLGDGEKVLDIGSGGVPFPYATHLADLYEKETTHRAEPLKRTHLPFQVCNIEELPYKDKEFDFVYCSHVLEHANDPARACEELMRVGRRGYIETPTRLSDIMLNFTRLKGHHKWHINLLGDALVFMEWAEKERRDTGISDFYSMLHSKYKNAFQDLVYQHRDLFENMFLWQDRFYYYVFNKNGQLIKSNRG